jgi:5-methylthioadenosine/S-adenosylhomocysteine deaminase
MPIEPQAVDLAIHARWIAPVEPAGILLDHHTVVVTRGVFVEILPTTVAASLYSAQEEIDLPDHLLIPVLINLHTHAAMTLLRGLADDRPLMDWLENHVWPAEMRFASPEFVHDGTMLACAEMLRGGVTCFNDMYFFPEAAAQATLASGMRAALGMIAVEFHSPYASDAGDYLRKGLALRDSLRDEPRLSFCLAPHAPYSVSDATLERIATYAGELDVPVHIHLHETADEIRGSIEAYGLRPLSRLQNLGLLGPGLIAVHAVHVTQEEIAVLAAHGCHVAHCPASNLKLASGIAPIPALLRQGVNVGLGTDGAASNNRLDILGEMRLAALLAKGASGDATTAAAHTILEMATLNSARALALDDRIGARAPGKRADMTAIDLSALETAPTYDPLSHLVYAAGREHVTHVWVDGELLVANGVLTRIDTGEIRAKAAAWKEKIGIQESGSGIQ